MTVTLYSDPIPLGVVAADGSGRVVVSFVLPADFPVGPHTIEFVGQWSGTTKVGFQVVGATTIRVSTGGSVAR